ncbi:MAG: hypothetical protein ACRDI2_07505, partial [Chloroflexota bacterium]
PHHSSTMDTPAILATATDPDGRPVQLTEERWHHILDGHPELGMFQDQILAAIRAPDERRAGRWPGEEWFYLGTTRPSRWLKVVVVYRGGKGRIITAFPRRSVP